MGTAGLWPGSSSARRHHFSFATVTLLHLWKALFCAESLPHTRRGAQPMASPLLPVRKLGLGPHRDEMVIPAPEN